MERGNVQHNLQSKFRFENCVPNTSLFA